VTVERRTVAGLLPPPDYAHVAVAPGGLVYTAGAVPLDREGRLVGDGDVAVQTEQVLANLLAALAEAGAVPADVAKTTVYVVGERSALVAAWEVVRSSPLRGAPSTLLGVPVLGYPGQLVEIEAVAVVGAAAPARAS
jgi:enamine deaminase RidA (YjgF/YER057c/UK114 family)